MTQDVQEYIDNCIFKDLPNNLLHIKNERHYLALFLDKFNESTGIRFECGSGWIPILLEMDKKLTYLDPHYSLSQVKEKFGFLRVYADLSIDYLDNPQYHIISELFFDTIALASHKSRNTCEICGSHAQLVSRNGWYRVRCDEHDK